MLFWYLGREYVHCRVRRGCVCCYCLVIVDSVLLQSITERSCYPIAYHTVTYLSILLILSLRVRSAEDSYTHRVLVSVLLPVTPSVTFTLTYTSGSGEITCLRDISGVSFGVLTLNIVAGGEL